MPGRVARNEIARHPVSRDLSVNVNMPLRLYLAILFGVFAGPAFADDGPPGTLIDVGGYRLHINCEGYGAPTVVFDTGLGGSALEWRAVAEEVREFTRVCTYDRAGYGWSDLGPLPRTSSTIANELYLLLDGLDFGDPFLLAGHSYGGYNVQLFARRYPYLVAGLVLIDSSHPGQVERFMAPPIGLNTAPTARWGMVKFGKPPAPHPRLPEADRRAVSLQMARRKTRRTLAHEFLGFRESAAELRRAQHLTAVPMVVISRGKRVWPAGQRGNLMENLWMRLQSELARQSPWSAHIVARDSGHQIHLDQPRLVAYAIAVLTDRYRNGLTGRDGEERQTPVDHERIDFHAATWLRDTLLANPAGLPPVAAR